MLHLNFPPDVEDFIHDLVATAILRAIANGTLNPSEAEAHLTLVQDLEDEKASIISSL